MHEDFYQMYLEELEGVAEAGPEEELALLERLAAGEAEAAGRLIEGNLKRVLAYAREYEGKGLPMNDLVQEANMAPHRPGGGVGPSGRGGNGLSRRKN